VEFVEHKEILLARESDWIARMSATETSQGFNYLPHGGGWLGGKHSEETKKKMSDKQKGRVQPPQTRAAVALANSLRVHSDETRRKISDAGKGKKHSEETLKKMRASVAHSTDEKRAKLSAALKGRIITKEHVAKIQETRRRTMLARKQVGQLSLL
jgi:hypothetical protein